MRWDELDQDSSTGPWLSMAGERRNFPSYMRLTFSTSFFIQYALVLVSTLSCGRCSQGVIYGSVLACCYLGVLLIRSFYHSGGVTRELIFGALLGIIPASFVGSVLVLLAELSRAVVSLGENELGLRVGEGLNLEATTADVFALRDLKSQSFRYHLMGQAHEALPLKEKNGARKAGKTEEGTFCAVPVVGDTWSVDEPVPFWYVCENNFQYFVGCRDAYEGVYGDKDYYGYRILRECLRAPLDIMDRWNHSEQRSTTLPDHLMYFYRLGFMNTNSHDAELAQSALVHSSANFRVALQGQAPKIKLAAYQEPCCASHEAVLIESIFAMVVGPLLACLIVHITMTMVRALLQGQGSIRAASKTRQKLSTI